MTPASGQMVKVLIVDDHQIVRAGLRMLLDNQGNLHVVGEAGDRSEALRVAASEQPDIILLDVDMGDDDGLAFLPELLAVTREARIIILTGVRDSQVYERAVRLGALGLVHKENATEVLVKAIDAVHRGSVWLDRALIGRVLGGMARSRAAEALDPESARIASLTKREREVIALVGEGLKNEQVGNRLFISETTVRHHLTSVFTKLGVKDRLELTIFAYRHGLAQMPK